MQGFILEVSITRVGSELDVDHALGATALIVEDVTPFLDDDGPIDQVEVNGAVLNIVSVNEATRTITVDVGLSEEMLGGEPVFTYPVSLEKWAMTEVNGQDEPVSALVGGDVYDKITDGVRDPEEQEAVVLELQNGDWTIVNLVGEEPVQSGEFLDPETMPPAPTDPEVEQALVDLRTEVGTNTGQLTNILGDEAQAGRLQNVEETAEQARNLANTADGRVSMSDYEPAPDDVSYIATDADGNAILDDLGNPVLLARNEGSVWFTRTRSRVNLLPNPSFETDTTGWTTVELTQSRQAASDSVAGSYLVRLTNNTVAALHHFYGPTTPAVPGAEYTGSIFARLVSATGGAGYHARLLFFDSVGTLVGNVAGPGVQLTATPDWERLSVTAVAPDTAATVRLHACAPDAAVSEVWEIDAGLLELSNILGRYFDGSLYAASWGEDGLGTPHNSPSHLLGGIITKVFELDDGAWVEKVFMGDTLVDLDASQILHGFMDGERIQDRSIPIDKIAGVPCTALEALVAGDLVHISNENGSFQARKASASESVEAHGFVLENAALGAIAYVYSHGYNPFLVDLEPGTQFLSTTPGAVSATPPQEVGTMVQRVGSAVGDSVLNFVQGDPIFIT